MKLYHNPRCSKSRQTLALLDENNIKFETIEYLKTPPSANELKEIVNKLGFNTPHDLIRTKESLYKDLDVSSSKDDTEELIKLMIENPKLIERPIFVTDNKAAIGRPPESVLELV
jgi:arsenate reductase (glutaredoxin)